MPVPQVGDINYVLIRPGAAATGTFLLVDVVTGSYVSGACREFALTRGAAQSHSPQSIWQQHVDHCWPMGDPVRLPAPGRD